ncbi:MAG: sensor histidine kinase [Clostridia bacterium]|nr:sensor histidine kinase [Clostridia bacterium]
MVQNTVSEFDKNVLDIQGILNNFTNSTVVFDEINSIPYSSDSQVKDILRYHLNKNKNIENILAINNRGYWDGVSRDNKFINSFYDMEGEVRLNEIIGSDDDKDKIYIIGLHSQNYFNGMNDYVFSFAKKYYIDDEFIGVLAVDVNIDYFVNAYNDLSATGLSEFMVLDGERCIYSNFLNDVDSTVKAEDITTYEASQIPKDFDCGGDLFYITKKSDLTNWDFYVKLSKNTIFKELDSIKTVLIFSSLIISILIISLYLRSVLSLFYPIKIILNKIKRIKNGNFDVKETVSSRDELGQISAAVDDMALSLKQHIEREYYYQIKQKKTELNALKMQIRPHFLYNTLEIIKMTAREEGAEKTSQMVSSLAVQFRYLLGSEDDLVMLSDEIEMLKNYMKLVKLRKKNVINIMFNVDDDTLECFVLKLMLQPIVENAIKHAIIDDDTELNITLCAYLTEDDMIITVYDNGCGMTGDKIKSIFEEQSDKTKHIGLKNINDRIKLLFGERFGIEIESSVNMGTLIKITIPQISDRGTSNEI